MADQASLQCPVVILLNKEEHDQVQKIGNNNVFTEAIFGANPIFIQAELPPWLYNPNAEDEFLEIIRYNSHLSLDRAREWVDTDEFTTFAENFLMEVLVKANRQREIDPEMVKMVRFGVNPESAMDLARKMLSKMFPNVTVFDENDCAITDYSLLGIDELHLGVKAFNCLCRAGISSIGELVDKSKNDLRSIPNLGKHTLEDIEIALADRKLALRQD